MGLDCEIDVWLKDGKYYLGHDHPLYNVESSFLKNKNLWCHAKNLQALEKMLKENIHCFWHQEDDYALTSENMIWCHPSVKPLVNSIAVLPEIKKHDVKRCHGVCSDYVKNYL
jgi:hypothetical protein